MGKFVPLTIGRRAPRKEECMDVKKKVLFFSRLKWFGLLMGVIMFCATFMAFGDVAAVLLGIAASTGFYWICSREGKRTMCQYVADDIRSAVNEAGHSRCIVEIRSISAGLITRVYLIRACGMEPRLNRAIIERINQSWYRKNIWVTQILGMEGESELEEAREYLDEALIEDIKRKRGESWKSEEERKKEEKR